MPSNVVNARQEKVWGESQMCALQKLRVGEEGGCVAKKASLRRL